MDNVPRREPNMTPYEILLSESQERMLLVAKPDKQDDVLAICRKWGIDAAVVGKVTGDGMLRVKEHGAVVAEIPAKALAEEGPRYERPTTPPQYQEMLQSLMIENCPDVKNPSDVLLELLKSPTIASKCWVYRQYDHMVGINTTVRPGSDAAVIRIKGTDKALALTTDGNSRYCLLNPYVGGTLAVAEAARNLVCSGAEPIGVTDCLNFGNPERPDIMWQFVVAIEGIADACRALNIPVVSGNVSFYNETNELSIYPTPILGMVGLIEPADRMTTQWFKDVGDHIILLGETKEDLGGTEYLKRIHHREQGTPPWLDLDREKAVQQCVLSLINMGLVKSAHDCSEGGLAVTLVECCVSHPMKPIGASIGLHQQGIRLDALLFGESPSRVVLTVAAQHVEHVLNQARECSIPGILIGQVGGDQLTVAVLSKSGSETSSISLSVEMLSDVWGHSLERALQLET